MVPFNDDITSSIALCDMTLEEKTYNTCHCLPIAMQG